MKLGASRGATQSIPRGLAACATALAALLLAGCGSSGTPSRSASPGSATGAPASRPAVAATPVAGSSPNSAAGFEWLRPASAPRSWRSAQVPSGATLAFPAAWRLVHGDRGTATAALLDAQGRFLGYLNVTPRQGSETLSDWATFRVHHNAEEGDSEVRPAGAATDLRFRSGRGSCVRDTYATSLKTHYEEIACLVAGRHAASVIVGATPVDRWSEEHAVIEQAISAMTT
jgi:hypothetical protein